MKPILIPSKGRANKCKTALLLGNLPNLFIVVEQQEHELYLKNEDLKYYNFIILPENDKGISYVRNYCLQWAYKMGWDWFWMIDDDINNFYKRENGKLIKDNNSLFQAEQIIDDKTAQISLEYQQFAWCANKDYILNSYNDVCVCINTKVCKEKNIKYRPYVNLKEDRDFTMQIIKSGYNVKRYTLSAFGAPKNGSNEGGLKDMYDNRSNELTASKRMIELWGEDICRLNIKKDGRPDCKIIWKNINKKQLNLF